MQNNNDMKEKVLNELGAFFTSQKIKIGLSEDEKKQMIQELVDRIDWTGAPKDWVSSLSYLNSNYPYGTTGSYVAQDNGHVYTYDFKANVWKDRGLYLSPTGAISLIKSNTLNIVKEEGSTTYTLDIPDDYATKTYVSNLYATKTELNDVNTSLTSKINADVSTLNNAISSNKTALIERMDNLSAEQEKALENEINNVKTGVTIVNRAINDEGGNDIQRTYPIKIITELNPTNYKLSITLLNKYNKTVSTQEVDFPAESSVVNARLDKSTNTLYLVLRNGNETAVPLSAIIRNLATEDYVVSKIEIISQRIDEEVKSLNAKIANTLVKPSDTTTYNRIPAIKLNSNDITYFRVASDEVGNTVPFRDGNGVLKVNSYTPSDVDNNASPKATVNNTLLRDYVGSKLGKPKYLHVVRMTSDIVKKCVVCFIDDTPGDLSLETVGSYIHDDLFTSLSIHNDSSNNPTSYYGYSFIKGEYSENSVKIDALFHRYQDGVNTFGYTYINFNRINSQQTYKLYTP